MTTHEVFELKVRAKPENLARIAAFVNDAAERWGLGPKETFDIQMAVDEACTNIIEHGYEGDTSGMIEIRCRQTDDECTIKIRDHGRNFDPDAVPEPDVQAPLEERPVGGLGLFFMRQLMDEVEFHFGEEEGNVLVMKKRREPVIVREPDAAEDVRVVAPRGRLDADLAQEVDATLDDLIAEGHTRLVLDFRHTTYISSSGLRVLLVAARQARGRGGDLKLFGLQPRVRKVFNMSGFDQIFSIFETEEAAIEALHDSATGQSPKNTTP